MKRVLLTIVLLIPALPVYASSSSVLLVGNNSSVANGVQVLGATTGNTPLISAQGSDTNIGLILTTQGTGALDLETAGSGNVILAPGTGNVTIPAFTTSGIVFNNSSGVLSSGTALPNGTTATTQSAGDNSTKVATTAYADAAVGSGIKSVHTQIFTSSGTYTPTTGMAYAVIEVVGGGGGGGGTTSSGNPSGNGAPGGGGGAYGRAIFSASSIGSSQSVTIGSGGTGGAAGNNAGSSGGTTSVGSLISASGGAGGGAGAGGAGAFNAVTTGGAGGSTISGATVAINGQAGAGGGGGSTESSDGIGFGGAGGNSTLGLGGAAVLSHSAGQAGTGYGGGGGGAASSESNGGFAGGTGASGAVIVTEYCTQ